MSQQVYAAVAALAVLAWVFRADLVYAVETLVGWAASDDGDEPPAKRRGPTYQQAMLDLARPHFPTAISAWEGAAT